MEKHEVSHTHHIFEFDAIYSNWTDFMVNLAKQLDELKISMNDVTTIKWEGGHIELNCIRIWKMDKEGKIEELK